MPNGFNMDSLEVDNLTSKSGGDITSSKKIKGVLATDPTDLAIYSQVLSVSSDLSSHESNVSNPHVVVKSQVAGVKDSDDPSFNSITSTVPIGTAPLVVASTTLVPNLYTDRAVLADNATNATNAMNATNATNADAVTWGHNSVTSGTPESTISEVDVLIPGLSITPGAGTYEVTLNSEYTLAPGNVTAEGAADLITAYNVINAVPATVTGHTAAFGSGEILTAGVYTIASAGSLAGTLTLSGNATDIFIFRFGAAFSTGAGSNVILTGGVTACNVFWIASGGAITFATNTTMKGTMIANNFGFSIAASCVVTGRMFSTAGIMTTNSLSITAPLGCSYLDIGILDTYAMFTSSGNYSNTGVSNITGDMGTNLGSFTGFETSTITGQQYTQTSQVSDASFSIYSDNVLVPNSTRQRTNLTISSDIFLLAVVTVLAAQAVEIRWRVETGSLSVENRTFTLTRVI